MAVNVQIPAPLRPLTGGAAEVFVDASSVRELVDALQARHAGLRERLLDESGRLRSYVRVFVNQDDVRSLEGEATRLRDGDVVAIVPAIAGGCIALGGLGAKPRRECGRDRPRSGGKPPVRRAGLCPDRIANCCRVRPSGTLRPVETIMSG